MAEKCQEGRSTRLEAPARFAVTAWLQFPNSLAVQSSASQYIVEYFRKDMRPRRKFVLTRILGYSNEFLLIPRT